MSSSKTNDRLLIIWTVIIGALFIGVAVGGTIPILGLFMLSEGFAEDTIGLLIATDSTGILLGAYFSYRMTRLLGSWLNVVLSATGLSLIYFFWTSIPTEYYLFWFPAWFLAGWFAGQCWVVTEAWLAVNAAKSKTEVYMGFYNTALLFGFLLGPFFVRYLDIVNTDSYALAFKLAGGCIALWCFIVCCLYAQVRRLPPMTEDSRAIALFFKQEPQLLLVFCILGLVDFVYVGFIPVIFSSFGKEELGLELVSWFVGGGLVFQWVLIYLTRYFTAGKILNITIPLGVILEICVPYTIDTEILVYVLSVASGALLFGSYSLVLATLAKIFEQGRITAVMGAAVFIFQICNLIGPLLIGYSISWLKVEGFSLYLVGMLLLYISIKIYVIYNYVKPQNPRKFI